jgi:hypothetical protein
MCFEENSTLRTEAEMTPPWVSSGSWGGRADAKVGMEEAQDGSSRRHLPHLMATFSPAPRHWSLEWRKYCDAMGHLASESG